MYQTAKYLPVGDKALLVEFGNAISLDVNRKVHALDHAIAQLQPRGILECVPTYRSLLVYYDPLKTSYEKLILRFRDVEASLHESEVSTYKRIIEVPTVYGGEHGPDLKYVAESHNLNEAGVVRFHSGREYTVYMIGFMAGFPYLGVVADKIATPRLRTPRLRVPAGSVGIAERQTGIYPRESPGGWQIIGRTPLKLFNPKEHPPTLIHPGDTVRFKPIGQRESEEYVGGTK